MKPRLTLYWCITFLSLTLVGHGAERSRPARDLQWVEQRVEQLQPVASEKRFDEIGWAQDLRTAQKLAAKHHRPVFLFTHDGRMNIGRC